MPNRLAHTKKVMKARHWQRFTVNQYTTELCIFHTSMCALPEVFGIIHSTTGQEPQASSYWTTFPNLKFVSERPDSAVSHF